jgi:hypothetical protein
MPSMTPLTIKLPPALGVMTIALARKKSILAVTVARLAAVKVVCWPIIGVIANIKNHGIITGMFVDVGVYQ